METAAPRSPAESYEQYFVPAMFTPWATALLGHAAPRPRERVLDVACGTGAVARQAAPLVGAQGQVAGLDMSPAMLDVARGLPPPAGAAITWHEGNAMTLPFPDAAFDIVLCQHGLQFVPDRAAAVREMRRVLGPGGRALVIVLQAIERHPVFRALMEATARHLALPLASVTLPFSLGDAESLRTLFAGAGFAAVEVVPETITARFGDADRFVPLAVTSAAAALPAFAQLAAPARVSMLDAVRRELEPTLAAYREGDTIAFPMRAHVAIARA